MSKRTDPYPTAFESLASFEPQYQIPAMTRSIEELARQQDARATPLLTRFLKHSDWRIRVQAIRGLEALNARESMPALAELARTDRESEVDTPRSKRWRATNSRRRIANAH